MRLTVTHYRILLLVVNILLGIGVPAFAAYRYYLTTKPTDAGVAVIDLKKLEPRDDGAVTGPNSAAKVAIVATWLNPKPASAVDTTDPGKPPDKTGPEVENPNDKHGELQPGKLGDEGWYYYTSIIREDPLKTCVVLRKRDAANPLAPPAGGAAASLRTNPRLKTTPRPAPRSSKVGKIAQQSGDHISFYVGDRRYINEELGLDFFIDSADDKKFVYWLPPPDGGPNKKYALTYKSDSEYIENRDEGLMPKPKTPEEINAEGQPDEKKPKMVIRSTKDWEPKREEEYQNMLKGIGLEPVSAPSDGGLRTIKPAANGAQPVLQPPGASGATPSKFPPSTSGTAPRGQRAPTAAETKQLDSAIKAMPPAAQKEFLDGLNGLNKAGTKAPK